MPASRQRPLRLCATQAIDAGNRMLDYIRRLQEAFEPIHPEYVPLLEAIAQMIIMSQVSMADLFKQAWGRLPPNYSSITLTQKE